MRRADLAAAAVLPAAALLLWLVNPGAPGSTGGGAGDAAAHAVPVTSSDLVCPQVPEGAAGAAAAVTSPALPDPADLPVRAVSVLAGTKHVGSLDARGRTWTSTDHRASRGLEARADGALATGLASASATFYDGEGDRRGLAAGACAEPASHWWFVGAGSTAGRSGMLTLANPGSGVAVVDLAFHGTRGPIDAAATAGVAIAPGSSRTMPLANLVPGVGEVAVEVTARQGEVVGALAETARDSFDPAGVDLLPPAAAPRRSAVLTAVGGQDRDSRHTLSVLNAGGSRAIVRVEVLGRRGAFTPTALEDLTVPAGGVTRVRVPSSVFDGATSGLRLTSDEPLTAAVRTTSGGALVDQSFASASPPVGRQTAAPVLDAPAGLAGMGGELVLSGAGRTAAIVDVLTFARDGRRLGDRTLDLRGGQTRTLPLKRGPVASVQVRTEGRAPVVAAVRWSADDGSGGLSASYPLRPMRTTVERPAVRYVLVPRQAS